MICDVVFNVQNQQTEPILNLAGYLCWPVQRIFERGETRHYDFIGKKISLVVAVPGVSGSAGDPGVRRRR